MPSKVSREQLKGRECPEWPPLESPRTKKAIVEEIAEAERAKEALPQLQARVEKAPALAKELEKWNRQDRWPERQAEAMDQAKHTVSQIHDREEELARVMIQVQESPLFRACSLMASIADLREALIDQVTVWHKVEFEKLSKAYREDESKPYSMAVASSQAAEASSPSKIKMMVEQLDPKFSTVRALPEQGPQRPIAAALWRLMFPEDFERNPLDPQLRHTERR